MNQQFKYVLFDLVPFRQLLEENIKDLEEMDEVFIVVRDGSTLSFCHNRGQHIIEFAPDSNAEGGAAILDVIEDEIRGHKSVVLSRGISPTPITAGLVLEFPKEISDGR